MDWIRNINNPHNDDKVMDACSLFGMMDVSGKPFSGTGIIKAIANMHVRSNGLGGGFAVYGLYPKYAEYYAFHLMYLNKQARGQAEDMLRENFRVVLSEEIPTDSCIPLANPPGLYRYFLEPEVGKLNGTSPDDFVIAKVMDINLCIEGAFVFSSGKNMGVFKGAGYPEDVAAFFRLEEYQGYLWTAHGRFPTNTPGWWGGAHPFNLLDWTVVHNGEISSYGTNRRYLEMFGYNCTLQTDTEVVTYAIDLLVRRHHLPIEVAAAVLAPAFWEDIERMPADQRDLHQSLRTVYGGLLLNGPFTIVIARTGEMVGLTDRIRLRPLTAAQKGDMFFLSSEESAIRLVSPELDRAWIPVGGQPVIARLNTGRVAQTVPVGKGAC